MVYRPSVDSQLCFVLMPFREPFNDYYTKIIKEAVTETGLEPLRGDEIYGTKSIIRDIWDHIWRARLIIADVTGKNPNVNYELGLCHALGVPTILITRHTEDIPFDYRHRRSIVYNTEAAGWDRILKEDLKKTIEVVLSSLGEDSELPWPYKPLVPTESPNVASLLTSNDPREILVQGARSVGNLVAKSFGPAGAYVSVQVGTSGQISQRHGLVVTQRSYSTNPLENRGIDQMKAITEQVYKNVGDYTKTAVILASSMLEQGYSAIKRGCPPRYFIQGMNKAVDATVSEIRSKAQPSDAERLAQIAGTAADDSKVGNLLGKVFSRMRKGSIVMEQVESDTNLSVTFVNGMRIDGGYLSEYFITDADEMKATVDDVLIMVCEDTISSTQNLLPILEQVAKVGKPILIIARDVEGEPLSTLVVNKLRGTLKVVAIKASGLGAYQKGIFEDVACYTDGDIIGAERGLLLENAKLTNLGFSNRVVVSKSETAIYGNIGKSSAVEERTNSLRIQIENATSESERELLRDRLENLILGIATVKIGGTGLFDRIDKKYRIESALSSARSSMDAGWLLGGGLTFFHISRTIRGIIFRCGNKMKAASPFGWT